MFLHPFLIISIINYFFSPFSILFSDTLLERNKLTTETDFAVIVEKIKSFLEPALSGKENQIWNFKEWMWKDL